MASGHIITYVIFSCTCFLLTKATTVNYLKKADQYVNYQADDILAESSAVVSHRHCNQLCTADANCTAVNYNRDTSNCQLLKTGVVSFIVQVEWVLTLLVRDC